MIGARGDEFKLNQKRVSPRAGGDTRGTGDALLSKTLVSENAGAVGSFK